MHIPERNEVVARVSNACVNELGFEIGNLAISYKDRGG
jgi:molybdopterin-binding protein